MKFFRTKPLVKNMKVNSYDLFYTVIKIRVEKEIGNDEYENIKDDYTKSDDFITLDHFLGVKNNDVMMR